MGCVQLESVLGRRRAKHRLMECVQVLREASKSAVLESRLLGLVLVAVDPDSSTLSPGDTPLQNTLNAHSDAWGWNSSSCGGQHHNTSAPVAAPLRHPCWDSFVSKVEQDLRQRAALTMAQFHATTGKEAQHPTLCLAIESLSTLVAYYSVGKVYQQVEHGSA